MTDAFISIGQALMTGWWSFFGIIIPGFTFTFGEMLIGFIVIGVCMTLIGIFGVGTHSHGTGYRSGSTGKPRISKERKDDEL